MKDKNWYKTLKKSAGIVVCALLLCIVAIFVINFLIDKSYDVIAADILKKHAVEAETVMEGGNGSSGESSFGFYEHSFLDASFSEESEAEDAEEINVKVIDIGDEAVKEEAGDKKEIAGEVIEEDVKYIALTFDDGPHSSYTPRILNILKEYDVKATFFIVGSCAEAHPDLVKQVYEHGHEVANHTYSHKNLTKLSYREALAEIEKSRDAIEAACGYSPVLVRPPEGAMTRKLADKLGYPMIFWTVDPEDWRVKNVDAVVEHVLEHVKENSVILLHDYYESTVQATELLIPKLREAGFEFVTVDRLIKLQEAEGKKISFMYQ